MRLRTNVLCCHENEKGIYGDTAERCLDLYQHFEGRLAGVFDPANFIQCGVHPLEAYEMLEPYILYMHVKDAKMADGSVTPAGAGDGQVGEILRRFQKMDGKRFLSLEPHLKVFAGLSALERTMKQRKDGAICLPHQPRGVRRGGAGDAPAAQRTECLNDE